MASAPDWASRRQALDLRRRGRSLADIADTLGISVIEASRRCTAQQRREDSEAATGEPWWYDGLSTSTANVLRGYGRCKSVADVLWLHQTGKLAHLTQFGPARYAEVCRWLDVVDQRTRALQTPTVRVVAGT